MYLQLIYNIVLEGEKHFSQGLFSVWGGPAGSREAQSNFSLCPCI